MITPSIAKRRNRRPRPNGFTLMELLIVISIMLILMLIAIPSYTSIKINANESSAISSLQAISTAELQYQMKFPANGYACTLPALGGDPKQGNPTSASAQLLQDDLAAGVKAGYTFSIVNCSKVTVNNVDQFTSFEVTAVPQVIGKTGHRGFCFDQVRNRIMADPAGGTNCTQPIS